MKKIRTEESILTRILYSGLSKTISVYIGKNDKEGLNRCYIANRMILIFGSAIVLVARKLMSVYE